MNIPYRGAGDAARQRVAALYEMWGSRVDANRRRLLGRPLSCTSDETRQVATADAEIPEQLAVELNVRLILLAEELDVDPVDPKWREVLAMRLLQGTLRGGVGWFLQRKPGGRRSGEALGLGPEAVEEAARLLEGVQRGRRQQALRPLLERHGVPPVAQAEVALKLIEAVRCRASPSTRF